MFSILKMTRLIRPDNLQQFQRKWQELLDSKEGEKLKKIICVDGKTMRSNKREGTKPFHIVSAWSREDGYCLGQKAVSEKSNKITAIPKEMESIEIKDQVVTIDAIGTQTAIVETIRKKRTDYVLAVKGNQGNLEGDIQLYFEDPHICAVLKEGHGYQKTVEKAHGQIDIREYYQTEDIGWMNQKKQWKGLKSIGMEKKTIRKGET